MINEQLKELTEKAGLKLDLKVLAEVSEICELRARILAQAYADSLEEKLEENYVEKEISMKKEYDNDLKEAFETLVEKADNYQNEKLETMMDYLDKVVDNIIESVTPEAQDEVAIEQALEVLKNQRKMIREYHIDENELEKVSESSNIREKYNSLVEESIKTKKEVSKLKKDKIIAEKTSKLSSDKVATVKSLCEDISFNENFNEKLDRYIGVVSNEKIIGNKHSNSSGVMLESVTDNDEVKVDNGNSRWMNRF